MIELSIFIAVFCIYFKTINYGLIVDDIRAINQHIKPNLENTPSLLTKIKHIVFCYGAGTLWTKRFSDETNTKIDHIFQTILHAIACVLIYKAFGSNTTSLIASILYAVNPINSQTSIWLNGRRYLINVILIMTMLILKPFGFVLYPLTFMYQMTGLFAPLLLGPIGIPFLVLGLFFARKRITQHIKLRLDKIKSPTLRRFSFKRLIVITKIFGFYVSQMILPRKVLMMYPNWFYWGMTKEGNQDAYKIDLSFVKGLLCLSGAIAGTFYFKNDLLWMWVFMSLSILQASVLGFTVIQGLADRYISVATAFGMLFLATFIHSYPVVVVGLLAYYFATLQTTMLMYRSLNEYYDYHIMHDYRTSPIRFYKAATYMKIDPYAAWMVIKDALILNPLDFKLNLLASECCVRINDIRGVKYYLELAELNTYEGQEDLAKTRIKQIRDTSGITAFDQEVSLIKKGKSKLSAKNRELLLRAEAA